MEKINQSGQAVTEYILLLAIVIFLFSAMLKVLGQSNAMTALRKPFTDELKYTYRYGHAKARGQDDGGPTYIPQRANPADSAKNFRIFINPPIDQ